MRFLIHAIPEREENVAKLMAAHALSPLKDVEMIIYNDKDHEGNLPAYLDSIDYLFSYTDTGADELIWHLQDDVVLLPNFWERVATYGKQYEEGLSNGSFYIYCGFTSSADYVEGRGWKATGEVLPEAMFYSFPCIGIPYWISFQFKAWVEDHEHTEEELNWIALKKYDDSLWQHFICQEWDKITRDGPGSVKIINLPKCLVDHRDDLCGGSVVNPTAVSMDRRARLR